LSQARFAAESVEVLRREPLEIFQTLEQDVADYIEVVRPHYSRFPLRDLLLYVDTLSGCTDAFARATGGAQKAGALDACRNGASLIADGLTRPLPVPDILPDITQEQLQGLLQAQPVEEEPEEEEEEAGPPPEVIAELTERWASVIDRITGWSRPNSTNAENLLDRLVQEMTDAHPEVEEEDLNETIYPVRELLQAYVDLTRGDFDDAESYSEARADAWQEFLDSFAEVDFSELGEM
jgi:hypothetical protein